MSLFQADNDVSKMTNDFVQPSLSRRAAHFLESEYPGPHRNKLIARDYRISPGMAKVLRSGRGWTAARFDQAIELHGRRFFDALFGEIPGAEELRAELNEIVRRLSRLEGRDQ